MEIDRNLQQATFVPNESDPLAFPMLMVGYQIIPAFIMDCSPIVIECYENWKPLLERICDKFGYCWEWIPDNVTEDYGRATMTKVVYK